MSTEEKTTGIPELCRDEAGLYLECDGMQLRGDFAKMLPRLKPGRLQQELLVKSAKTKGAQPISGGALYLDGEPLRAVDATAGLGEDAILLAAAGFEVTLFEQDDVVAALLEDALVRAAADELLAPIVARMHFVKGDSIAGMHDLGFLPDVVLLDPMFPARQKSAAVKKKFQLIHHLEKPCENEEELFAAAEAAKPRKIIVKRPPKGPLLAGKKPSYDISGKAVRYDVYSFAR